MRSLNRNEVRMLVLFGAAVFVALNLFAIRAWSARRSTLARDISAASASIAESRSLISAVETLASARTWIEANPPPENTPQQASTELLGLVRAAAEENGLKIIEDNLLPSTDVPSGKAVGLQSKFSGPFPGAAKFLFALQSPTAWRATTKILMRSDNEPPNVLLDVEIRQYYRTPDQPAPPVPPTNP